MKELLLEFLAQHELCVVSTIHASGDPESALVGFTHTDGLEFIIGTSNKSRKYANIIRNPHIALVVGDETAEMQYEGVAEVIPHGEYRDMVERRHIIKLPGAVEYRDDPTQEYIKVVPTWVRFLKHGNGGTIEEFTEFEDES